jgi:hypothetical protein
VDRQRRAAGRGDGVGIALGVVLGAAVTWNLAANLWLPWTLYVPGGLLLAAILVGVAVRIGGCRWSDLGLDRHELRRGLGYGAVVALSVTVVLALGAALPGSPLVRSCSRRPCSVECCLVWACAAGPT